MTEAADIGSLGAGAPRTNLKRLFRQILVGAATEGLDVIGPMVVNGAWPVLRGALGPVLDRLSARFEGRDLTSSPELAKRAAAEFDQDVRLQELLKSSLLDALRPVVEGQERVETSLQSLYEVSLEGTAAAREVLDRLDEGVHLDDASMKQLADLVAVRVAAAGEARTYAREARAGLMEPTWLDLGEIQSRAVELQVLAIELIDQGRFVGAEAVLEVAQSLLAKALEETPTDPALKTLQGFVYKDVAQAFFQEGRVDEGSRYLDLAEGAFRLVLQDPPADATVLSGAWNGLGNVLASRGAYPAAIEASQRAVSLYPDYAAAWYDLLVMYGNQAPDARPDLAKVRTALENLRRTAPDSGLPEDTVRSVEAWAAELLGHD